MSEKLTKLERVKKHLYFSKNEALDFPSFSMVCDKYIYTCTALCIIYLKISNLF